MQKKEKILGGAMGAAGGGALEPGAAPVTLGLFLLPGGRPGRRLAGTASDDPAAARVALFLFLLPRGNHLHQPCGQRKRLGAKVQMGTICISHVDKGKG
jgi:hypothetical protein